MHKLPAALESPYVEVVRKVSSKCSWDVAKVYEAVCSCPERRTKFNNREYVCLISLPFFISFLFPIHIAYIFSCTEIIINYEFNHTTLGDLVDSVKPGGKMKNTIAEIGIYVINGKKMRGATKCVMPLHISVRFLSHICFAANF